MSTPSAALLRRSKHIRALTTTIQYVQPHHAASDTPVLAAGGTYKALSKAYNYLAILLTQGLEREGGAERQVIAITGQVKGSSVSVSAITEVDELPLLSSSSFTSNPHMKQDGPTLVEVKEIKKSETPLQDLADPAKKCVCLVLKLPQTYICPVQPIKKFRSWRMHQICFRPLSITRQTTRRVRCSCDSCGCDATTRSNTGCAQMRQCWESHCQIFWTTGRLHPAMWWNNNGSRSHRLSTIRSIVVLSHPDHSRAQKIVNLTSLSIPFLCGATSSLTFLGRPSH